MQFPAAVLLLFALATPAFAQQGQGPERQVPPLIAKVPERTDFNGEWLRSDGTYRLKVAKAGKTGGVSVQYFNPNPINVESAAFSEEEGRLILTVVLRDEGYPGSTYKLFFEPSFRVLAGAYLMPQQRQEHQVYFQPVQNEK